MTSKNDPAESAHKPFVPENMEMTEFTYRAVLLGIVMTVILGPRTPTSASERGSPSPLPTPRRSSAWPC